MPRLFDLRVREPEELATVLDGFCDFYRTARLVEYTSALRCHESTAFVVLGLAIGSRRSRVRLWLVYFLGRFAGVTFTPSFSA